MREFIYLNKTISVKNKILKAYEIGIVRESLEKDIIVEFIFSDVILKVSNELAILFNPSYTGDAYDKKVCNVCHRILPVNEFPKNQNGINNRPVRRPSCNDCREIIDGKGLSSESKRIFLNQKPRFDKFTCPICLKVTIPGLTSKVVLDHDHHTGKARAWICDSCNTGLGRFKDNIEILENAITYLKSE